MFDTPTLLGNAPDAYQAQLGDADATATVGDLELAATLRDPVTSASERATLDGPTIRGDEAVGTAGETASLEPGQRFGMHYRVRLIGEDGMGAVYKAFDNEIGVDVALKVIRPEQMRDGKKAAALERRFKRELLLWRKTGEGLRVVDVPRGRLVSEDAPRRSFAAPCCRGMRDGRVRWMTRSCAVTWRA